MLNSTTIIGKCTFWHYTKITGHAIGFKLPNTP
jgi:hypothetical protein